MTHFVIYGAGGVGCVIGAGLAQAGYATTLIARGAHARALQTEGLRLVTPAGVTTHRLPTVAHPRELTFDADTVVLLCMKSQHTAAALDDLAAVANRDVAVVCVQNGVANERLALARFPRTYATVVVLPALFLKPGEVVTHAAGCGGILDTGCYPEGVDSGAEMIAAALTAAGFSAHADPHVMRSKYAKLLTNLYNVVQAALPDAAVPREIREYLRTEALACYAAAEIDCASAAQTQQRHAVMQMVEIKGYPRTGGSTWQSLVRGTGDMETEFLNGEICRLGRLHGVATPANDTMVEVSREIVSGRLPAGAYTQAELLERIAASTAGGSDLDL